NAAVGLANAAGMPGRSPHIAGSPSTYLRAGNLRGASPPPTNTTSALRHAQSRRRRPRSPPPDRRSRHQGGSIPMSTSGSIPVSAKAEEQGRFPAYMGSCLPLIELRFESKDRSVLPDCLQHHAGTLTLVK